MSDFTISELPIPAAAGADGWDDFVAISELRNVIMAELTGNHDLEVTPVEALPRWQDPNEPRRLFAARVDGRIVGRGVYAFGEDGPAAWLNVSVEEKSRERGIGGALHEHLAALAASDGRTVFQTEVFARADESGPQIISPSGFGSVSADERGVRFAQRLGYQLELVMRLSRLPLPVDPVDINERLQIARAAAGRDYRLVRWIGPTPENWLRDVAIVRARIMTDAPHGDLVVPEEEWTEQRVRDFDARESHGGRVTLVSAVEHVPSGRLVGYNDLQVPPQLERPVSQGMTLVLSEHRGHRLGMLMKVDNILQLSDTHPGHPGVETMNAEENRPMLSVNEAVGFVATAKYSGWKQEAGS